MSSSPSSSRKHAGTGPASDVPPVPEPSFSERARTLMYTGRIGSLSTIFLVYPPERTYDPTGVSQWTNLYDNWILATVGPHLTYYGTFENFTKHVPIDLASTNEKATFEFYSARFTSQRSKSDLTLVVVSFLYGGSRLGLIELSQPVTGAYMSKVSFA